MTRPKSANPVVAGAVEALAETIRDGAARTLWLLAYAGYAEENEDDETIDRPGPAGDWDTSAPATPLAAVHAADALMALITKEEGKPVDLFMLAMEIDDGQPFEVVAPPEHVDWRQKPSSARTAYDKQIRERNAQLELAEEFGSMLAHMAIGTGVSWFDDHKQFELDLPSFEVHYDGEFVSWSGQGGAYGNEHAFLGDVGKLVAVNPNGRDFHRHRFVLRLGAHSLGTAARDVLVYADGIESALDEAVDWAADNLPGIFVDDQIEEEYSRLRKEGLSEEQAIEQAEVDTTSAGNEGQHINSDDWHVIAEDPPDEELLVLGGYKKRNPTPSPAMVPKTVEREVSEPAKRKSPAWTTRALALSFDFLEDRVPPEWLPRLGKVKPSRGGKWSVALRSYGCGAFGCVLPTHDKNVVLKLTTDPSEAHFAGHLSQDLAADVIVGYMMVVQLTAEHQGRPIYLLWRQAADHVGEVGKIVGARAAEAINRAWDAAQVVNKAIKNSEALDKAVREWLKRLDEIEQISELEELAIGLRKLWEEQRLFVGDVHDGNVGVVNGRWVVVDPGHVSVVH